MNALQTRGMRFVRAMSVAIGRKRGNLKEAEKRADPRKSRTFWKRGNLNEAENATFSRICPFLCQVEISTLHLCMGRWQQTSHAQHASTAYIWSVALPSLASTSKTMMMVDIYSHIDEVQSTFMPLQTYFPYRKCCIYFAAPPVDRYDSQVTAAAVIAVIRFIPVEVRANEYYACAQNSTRSGLLVFMTNCWPRRCI